MIKTVKNYWLDEKTNIFNNYMDALAGFVVLIVIPACSVILVVCAEEYTFWSYTFPIVSISLAGAYDAYGRYDGSSPKNPKLLLRVIIDFLASFFAAVSIGIDNIPLLYAAPVLLLVCGMALLYEIYSRIQRAVLISPWCV